MVEDEVVLDTVLGLDFETTSATDDLLAVLALDVVSEVVGMEVSLTALRTYERILVFLHLHSSLQLPTGMFSHLLLPLIRSRHACIQFRPRVQTDPYRRQLRQRAELAPLQLISVMVELVATGDRMRLAGFVLDPKLDLAQHHLVVPDVDEDVVGALAEAVFYADYLQLLGVEAGHLLQLAVHAEDLLLARVELAPDEVAQSESDEVGRRGPVVELPQLALFVEVFRHFAQPMDQPIEIGNRVTVQVIHHPCGELPTHFLQLVELFVPLPDYLPREETGLHDVVIGGKTSHELLDLCLLLGQMFVEYSFHPG